LPSPAIVITLQLSAVSDRVAGSVGVGAQTSTFDGYRSTFHSTINPATSFVGKYTLAFSGSDNAATSPQGNGSAGVAVQRASGAFHVGVDLMFELGGARHRVIEGNAFGDLLPNLERDGLDVYSWQITRLPAA